MAGMIHVPVSFEESMEFLRVLPGGTYVDCTVGLGGHTEGLLRRIGPRGRLIGFDRDPEAIKLARERLERVCGELGSEAPELELIDVAFSAAAEHVAAGSVDGVLADFGVSSLQLDEAREDLVFRRTGLWTCGWIRAQGRPPHKW